MPVVDPGGVPEGTDAEADEEDSEPGIRDSGFGIRDRRSEARFADVHAQRAAAEGVSSALRQRPDGHARRGAPAELRDQTSLKVIVDRVKLEGDMRARLTDSIETAYREAGGTAFAIEDAGHGREGAHLQRAVRVPELQPDLRSAAAAGCFRSTTRSAPARRAMGSATSSSSISIWWCPIRTSRSSRARSSRGRRRTTARSWPS